MHVAPGYKTFIVYRVDNEEQAKKETEALNS
jgi:hypothetical protein